jgi:hypothetical protein
MDRRSWTRFRSKVEVPIKHSAQLRDPPTGQLRRATQLRQGQWERMAVGLE